jgi:cation:H+ antiporter
VLFSLLAVAAGLVLLAKAADQFVVGAARLATLLKISPIVIGAVIIGFGTSMPEALVSGLAAVQGDIDLGVGNVVGSNIANLALVLGVAAIVAVVRVGSGTIRREVPLSAGACLVFVALAWDGLSRLDAVLLTFGLVVFLIIVIRAGVQVGDAELVDDVEEYVARRRAGIGPESLRTIIGLVGTIIGAQLLVTGARSIAESVGVSEGFIGLSLVAIGTSLPELVTAIAAARRREDELIVGNLLGSNAFNSLGVGAVLGFAGPGPLADPGLAHLGMITMLVVVALASVMMSRRRAVVRWEGIALVGVYVAALVVIAT